MKKVRKKKYQKLRKVRRERDYQSGRLQYANRPITKPSLTIHWINGKLRPAHVTTKQFIERNDIIL